MFLKDGNQLICSAINGGTVVCRVDIDWFLFRTKEERKERKKERKRETDIALFCGSSAIKMMEAH